MGAGMDVLCGASPPCCLAVFDHLGSFVLRVRRGDSGGPDFMTEGHGSEQRYFLPAEERSVQKMCLPVPMVSPLAGRWSSLLEG